MYFICVEHVFHEFKFKKGPNNFGYTTCIHYDYSHLCIIYVITVVVIIMSLV